MGKIRNRCWTGPDRPPEGERITLSARRIERFAEAQRPLGTLYMVATPIGNLEDVTIRALRVLREVVLIAAEDTRRTRILLETYDIDTPLTSLYEQNEAQKSALILNRLQSGESIAYVSDAGTPGISDPGYLLTKKAIELGIPVVPVPGPCALITALSASGLPMDHFAFFGFLPNRVTRRRERLRDLKEEARTLIFYESPHRLIGTLKDIEEVMGTRPIVVSRELTKIHEEFLRGTATEISAALGEGTVKGEVTLIVAGRPQEPRRYSDEDLLALCADQMRENPGASLRDRANRIAAKTGVPRNRIYRLLLFS